MLKENYPTMYIEKIDENEFISQIIKRIVRRAYFVAR